MGQGPVAAIQNEKRREDKIIRFIAAAAIVLFTLEAQGADMRKIDLPEPKLKGAVSVEEAIQKRRSVRSYSSKELSMADISQLLWACQGITDTKKLLRASPSAGALYPLEIYLVKDDGLFHYIPEDHKLEAVSDRDLRADLAAAAYGQGFVKEAAIDIVICAVYERITSKYGDRGIRYTDMEAGHAAENVFLQAVALGLDSVPVGAFSDAAVSKALNLPAGVKPLYILPVGYKK
jgi:SagB-type dehydrogenase family enzyme